jgi:hypothetical protein
MGPNNKEMMTGVTLETCAEACHMSNMHWMGWAGPVYRGWNPDRYNSGSDYATGHIDYVSDKVKAFYCEGFSYNEDSKECVLYSEIEERSPGVSDSGTCYVAKETPNPCGFTSGDWVRSSQGEYMYVGTGDLLFYAEMQNGNAPTCNGVSVFGNSADAPQSYCNGYDFESTRENPADSTCAVCLNHMLNHNMLGGVLDGSTASCDGFSLQVTRGCEGETVNMECPSGTKIQVGGTVDATFARIDNAYCKIIPAQSSFTSAAAPADGCGSAGNVQSIVADKCDGHISCTLELTNEFFGTSLCPETYKTFAATYECLA